MKRLTFVLAASLMFFGSLIAMAALVYLFPDLVYNLIPADQVSESSAGGFDLLDGLDKHGIGHGVTLGEAGCPAPPRWGLWRRRTRGRRGPGAGVS